MRGTAVSYSIAEGYDIACLVKQDMNPSLIERFRFPFSTPAN